MLDLLDAFARRREPRIEPRAELADERAVVRRKTSCRTCLAACSHSLRFSPLTASQTTIFTFVGSSFLPVGIGAAAARACHRTERDALTMPSSPEKRRTSLPLTMSYDDVGFFHERIAIAASGVNAKTRGACRSAKRGPSFLRLRTSNGVLAEPPLTIGREEDALAAIGSGDEAFLAGLGVPQIDAAFAIGGGEQLAIM